MWAWGNAHAAAAELLIDKGADMLVKDDVSQRSHRVIEMEPIRMAVALHACYATHDFALVEWPDCHPMCL
jgi:predicted Fe-Mo cluster-binding NifX family protein